MLSWQALTAAGLTSLRYVSTAFDRLPSTTSVSATPSHAGKAMLSSVVAFSNASSADSLSPRANAAFPASLCGIASIVTSHRQSHPQRPRTGVLTLDLRGGGGEYSGMGTRLAHEPL